MKRITWLGNTHELVKRYPPIVRQQIGYNLDKVQRGFEPHDWKPISSVGKGVVELRIHEESEYRVLYVAKFEESIYILNVFRKKTQQTPKREIDLAKRRYEEMLDIRRVQR